MKHLHTPLPQLSLTTKGRGGISLSHPHFMDEETEVPLTD